MEFGKKDLENGMIVEYDNGERALVVDDTLVLENDWDTLEEFADDLSSIFNISSYDDVSIIKVYKTKKNIEKIPKNNFEKLNEDSLIWSRDDIVKDKEISELEKKIKSMQRQINGLTEILNEIMDRY